jgi:hypothetical protein
VASVSKIPIQPTVRKAAKSGKQQLSATGKSPTPLPQRGKAATKIKPPKSFAEKKELYG